VAAQKRLRSQGGVGIYPARTFFVQGGFFRCGFRTWWRKKLRIFRNLWCVQEGGRGQGVEPVQTGIGWRDSIFRSFVRTSFYERPLFQRGDHRI